MTAQVTPPGTTLHVAALPFPSHQGTQALLRRMLEVSTDAGRDAQLLTYAQSGYALAPSFPLHRLGDFPKVRSLRSGPSGGKLLLDARLVAHCHALCRRLQPSLVVAHNLEAGLACLPQSPRLFFAHTDMAEELPTYGPAAAERLLGGVGAVLDRLCLQGAGAVAAVSPALRDRILERHGGRLVVTYVPPPWPVPDPTTDGERMRAREQLGLCNGAPVILYAGNLDAYQGWTSLLPVLAIVAQQRPSVRMLVASQSDTRPLLQMAQRAAVADRILFAPLTSEDDRRRIHAAADLSLIPRRAAGGLPIKLLDSMARGVPVVCNTTAAAGLPLHGAAMVVETFDPQALGRRITELLDSPERLAAMTTAGRRFVAREHSNERYMQAFDRAAATALVRSRKNAHRVRS